MSHTVTFTFHDSEQRETPSQDTSPYDEGAVHDSFHQLIQEQSLLAEQVEMQDLSSRGRENLVHVVSSAHQTEAWEEPRQTREHTDFSSATLRILASMPSRTIGRNRGAIISQYCNRTARLRRRSNRAPFQEVSRSARPSLRQLGLELDSGQEEEDAKRSLLVKELRNLPASQRINMLKAMPLSLAEKCKLRQESSGHSGTLRKPKSTTFLSHCSWLKYYIIIGFRSLWYSLLSVLHTLQPWHYSLKQISGRFGSSILSYFLFLKTLLMFNFLLFLLLLIFVIAIQAAYPSATPDSEAFTGLEPLTGAGNFTHTLMYYGYYSNFTLNDPCAFSSNSTYCRMSGHVYLPYNMPLAYLSVIGVAFFVMCILLVYSMSHSFGESYRVDSASGYLAVKVFCAWDYKVTQKHCAQLQSEKICTHLKECLAERWSRSHPFSLWKTLQKRMILFLAWSVSLSTVLGSSVAVHYFSEYIHQLHHNRLTESNQTGNEALLLALPLLVSLINLLAPYMYNLLAVWEKRESPVLEVYVAICRNLILKMVILGLLCYHWLSPKVTSSKIQCWETFVGQELYRLVVMDFIFILFDTFFGEFIWRIILEKKLQSKPEFDIARNVLELIYGQTLTWLGVFFAPLLPVVQILKLLLLFYIKKILDLFFYLRRQVVANNLEYFLQGTMYKVKTSLMRNCHSPRKPWRASHMSTVFITLLCFPSFLGASVFLSYTIWSVKPSQKCGPFQTFDTIYDSGKTWVLKLEKSSPNLTWFTWIHQHMIQNTFFVFFISGILLAVIYLNIQVVKGQRRIISLLKEQIANEGEDKTFLIQKLHSIYRK